MRFNRYPIMASLRRLDSGLPVSCFGFMHVEVRDHVHLSEDEMEVCIRFGDESGEAVDVIGGKEYRSPFPHVLFKLPGVRHVYSTSGKREFAFLVYPAEAAAELRRRGFPLSSPIRPIRMTRRLAELLNQLQECSDDLHAFGMPERVDALGWEVLLELWQSCQTPEERFDPHEKNIRAAASYLNKHCDEAIELEQVIRRCGMSRSVFFVEWKRFYRETPARMLLNLRIDRAKSMLAETRLPVGAVAEKLHFANVIHFIRVFRAHTGLSPRQYRLRTSSAEASLTAFGPDSPGKIPGEGRGR